VGTTRRATAAVKPLLMAPMPGVARVKPSAAADMEAGVVGWRDGARRAAVCARPALAMAARLAIVALLVAVVPSSALDNGAARTPPMVRRREKNSGLAMPRRTRARLS